ncbi:M20 family metallopeptidase [uncultured Aquimarina sp.]|uniref:M20 metallopeptidase family protein n=1 Tax=uncultured Aquimarina sp. TaxID=575652 RepID=UPI002602900B|nr:amidohydrolase [uncultured Aquimarina sp.]
MITYRTIVGPTIFILFLFFGVITFGQESVIKPAIHKSIQQQTNKIFDDLVKIHRDFHMNPEVSEQEKRTAHKIKEYLLSIGLEVKTNIGGNGVVGILKGAKEGKKIAWRADIDAMPSEIPDVVDFKSKTEGVRHICGHDVHATIALGIANVLASQKDQLKGTVYFIFQPSEENYKGAQAMIEDGLFDIINPEEIYAAHIAPLPATMISTKPEWLFADYKVIEVSYKNSGDDDAMIEYTKTLLKSFQNVEPGSKFFDPQSLLNPAIGLANPNTIFKDYTTVYDNFNVKKTEALISIKTYVGSSIFNELDRILPQVKQKIKSSKYSTSLVNVSYSGDRANLMNDKKLTNKAMNAISTVYGSQSVIRLYGEMPDGRGDDFAYFQEKVPGTYFFLGGSNFEKGIISMPHAPNFAIDEISIKTGVNYFSSLIVERLFQ